MKKGSELEMSIVYRENIPIEEFQKICESTDSILEYIDGTVYMTPSPSTKHQRLSSRIHAELYSFLKEKECEVFPAPFDIELHRDDIPNNKVVVPDLSVICDKKGLGDDKFVGVPTLLIEILSPSNQSHDLVVKLNLYMKYGVQEYWIVNPMLNTVQIYLLDDAGQYNQLAVKEQGVINSEILQDFTINLNELFQ